MAKAKSTKTGTTASRASAKTTVARAKKAATAAKPRIEPRAEITAMRAAIAAGRTDDVDLEALDAAYEAVRASAEQPARLFALAVEHARVLDGFVAVRGAGGGEALVAALSRVLEGAGGTRDADLAWALERLETALRGAIGRALDDAAQLRALAALVDGYTQRGDRDEARRAGVRWVRRAEKATVPGGKVARAAEHDRAMARAFEMAIEAHDLDDAIRWSRARAAALTAAGARSDALAPLWRLWADQGSPGKALEAARAWLAAERTAQSRDPSRAGRLVDALAGLAQAALLAGDDEACADATREWVARATEHTSTEHKAFPQYGAARLAEALAMQTELHERRGEAAHTLRAAHAWQAAERAASAPEARGVEAEGTLRASLALVRALDAVGDAERAAPEAEDLLSRLERIPAARREDTEAQGMRIAVRQIVRAVAARAHFARGDVTQAATRAREWLDVSQGAEPEAAALVALLGASEELALPAKSGAARTRAIEAWTVRARRLATALEDARPRRDAGTRAAALAGLSRAESVGGSGTLAQRHADEAVARLRSATTARSVRAYVAWAHESLAISTSVPLRTTRRSVPPAVPVAVEAAVTAARALAAAQSGARTRACALLATLDTATLGNEPDTLAHVLAAGAHVLVRLAPDDAVLREGLAAWRDIAPVATLPGARVGAAAPDARG